MRTRTIKARRRSAVVMPETAIHSEPMFAEGDLPLVVQPAMKGVSLKKWCQTNRAQIDQWLQRHAGILFRGFGVADSNEFSEIVAAASNAMLEYTERSSPRHAVSERIYTSTDYPKDEPIFLHNENSYQGAWPLKLFFYCDVQPATLGATPIADCRRIFDQIPETMFQKFRDKGIMYVRNFNRWSNVRWQDVFQTEDRAVVNRYCAEKGLRAIWKYHGEALRTEVVRPLVWRHPVTNAATWFNHATFFHTSTLTEKLRQPIVDHLEEDDYPSHTYYGDGSPIEPEVLDHLRAVYEKEKIRFSWERGDVLLLDNMLAAHGREPFAGERRILVAMAEPLRAPAHQVA